MHTLSCSTSVYNLQNKKKEQNMRCPYKKDENKDEEYSQKLIDFRYVMWKYLGYVTHIKGREV